MKLEESKYQQDECRFTSNSSPQVSRTLKLLRVIQAWHGTRMAEFKNSLAKILLKNLKLFCMTYFAKIIIGKQDRHCTCNVTVGRVRANIAVVEKQ